MNEVMLSAPDKNGIIRALSGELSEKNKHRLKQFSSSMFFMIGDLQNVCHRNGLNFSRCDTNGGILYFRAHKEK